MITDINIHSSDFTTLLDNMDETVFIVDYHSNKPVFVNQSAEKLTGIPIRELYESCTNWLSVLHEEDVELFASMINILNEKKQAQKRLRIYDKKGNLKWVDVKISKILSDGKPYQLHGIIKDITANVNAKTDLESSQTKLSIILKYLPNIVLYETRNNETYISENIHMMLGYQADELTAKIGTFKNLIHPDDAPVISKKIADWYEAFNQTNQPNILKVEFRCRHKDGHYIWLEDYLINILPMNGKNFMTGILVDITERKQNEKDLESRVTERTKNLKKANQELQKEINNRRKTEQQLKKSEAIYRLLASNIPNSAVCLVDSNFKLLYPEGYGVSSLGLTKDFLEGKTLDEILNKADLDYLHPAIEKFKAGETAIIQTKYNDNYYILSLIPLDVDEPEPILGLLMLQNITDLKMAQIELKNRADELGRSNADLEQFAYVASHDLKEPIRMIGSYAQLINKRYGKKLDKTAIEFMQYIIEGVNRVHTLLDDLLRFSRVSQQEKQFETVDMNLLLQDVLQNLKLRIEERNARIEIGKLPSVQVDKSLIIQLFQNLIDNALKFSKTNPLVRIQAEKVDHQWVFSISDNGVGINQEYFEKIFIIFQRLHTRKEYPGTGIGLAICKKIVNHHNGEIWVESKQGKGTTFYFSLPVKQPKNK